MVSEEEKKILKKRVIYFLENYFSRISIRWNFKNFA